MKLSKRIIFITKVNKVSNLYYSEFQCETILFLENLEQRDIVIYNEIITKSKINHFLKIIQNDQPSFNIFSSNYIFKAYFD